MEYMIITALALFILIPIVYLFYEYSYGTSDGINYAQLNKLGNDIINNAESIYYLGQPSKAIIKGTMPESVTSIEIINDSNEDDYEIVFTINENNEISFKSSIRIDSTNKDGVLKTFDEEAFTKGVKSIKLESFGDYVNISIY